MKLNIDQEKKLVEIRKVLGNIPIKDLISTKEENLLKTSEIEGKGEDPINFIGWAKAFKTVSQIYPSLEYKPINFDIDGNETENGFPYQPLNVKVSGLEKYEKAYNEWIANMQVLVNESLNKGVSLPDAYFDTRPRPENFHDSIENVGYQVCVEITIDGITHRQWLPIMEYNLNFAPAKNKDYVVVKDDNEDSYIATVGALDSTMVNTSIQRCFVKGLTFFNFGLSLYETVHKMKEKNKEKDKAFQEAVEKNKKAEDNDSKTGDDGTSTEEEKETSLDEAKEVVVTSEVPTLEKFKGRTVFRLISNGLEGKSNPNTCLAALEKFLNSDVTEEEKKAAKVLLNNYKAELESKGAQHKKELEEKRAERKALKKTAVKENVEETTKPSESTTPVTEQLSFDA